MLYGTIYATPQSVQRQYVERRAAGQLAPDEVAPQHCYRALLGMELDPEGEDKPKREPGRYPFVMSVGTPDGANDVVEQSWKLDRFNANPVAFFNHRSWGLPVGKWENVRVEGGVLRGDFVATEATEEGRTIRAMLDERVLRAASVGFIPGKVTERNKYPTTHPLYAERGYVFSENNLFECSIVGVPMHPDATREERSAEPEPAPAPEAAPAPAAEPATLDFDAVERAIAAYGQRPADDGQTLDLDAVERAVMALFPITT